MFQCKGNRMRKEINVDPGSAFGILEQVTLYNFILKHRYVIPPICLNVLILVKAFDYKLAIELLIQSFVD